MSTTARKARKRAGIRFAKTPKQPTRVHDVERTRGIGLVTGPEILAALVIRGIA